MSAHDHTHEAELQRTLIALLEDEAPDHSQLDALLRDDDAACDEYLKMIRLHAILQREFGGRAPIMRVQGSGFGVPEEEDLTPTLSSTLRLRPEGRPSPLGRSRSVWYAVALAAAIALALTGWFAALPEPRTLNPEPSTVGVAMITDTHGARWADAAVDAASGAALDAGPLTLLEGRAQIMFHSGAVVDLQGPTEFELVGESRGVLKRGVISAWVPDRAVGFTIDTPDCRIVDMGTEFTVAVDPSVFTHLAVLHGRVRLEPFGAAAWSPRVLIAGAIARIAGADADPQIVDADLPVQRVLVEQDFEIPPADLPADWTAQRTTERQNIRIESADASPFGPPWNRSAIALFDDDDTANLLSPKLIQPIPDFGDQPLQVRFDVKFRTLQQHPVLQIVDDTEQANVALNLALAYPSPQGAKLGYSQPGHAMTYLADMLVDRWYRITLNIDSHGMRYSLDLQRRSADGHSVDQRLRFDDLPLRSAFTWPAHLHWLFNVPPGRGGSVLIDNLRISIPTTSTNTPTRVPVPQTGEPS